MRLSVIELEKIILKELGFELYRIMDHPHKLMHHYLKLLKASNEVARKAWNYLNDSYRLSLCVHYPSSTIAASCIYLSLRSLSIPMPNKPWWVLMETSIEQIHDICAEVLNLYSQPKICLKDIKDIIEDSCKCLKIEINYSFAYDDLFENEENPIKIEIDDNSFKIKNSNIFGKNIFCKDVNSSSSTVKEINKKDAKNSDRNSKRPSKTKSKSPTTQKDRNKNKKRRKNRNNRSRSRSKSDRSESCEKSEESERERSDSRHRRRNSENRNRRKRREEEKEKKRRKRSRENEKSGEKSRSKSKKNAKYIFFRSFFNFFSFFSLKNFRVFF